MAKIPSSIFELDTYQQIILFQLEREPRKLGAKSRLAQVAGVQPAYLSQVLSNHSHLNLDQGANLAYHWNFNEIESEYFLSLISLARAASIHLQAQLQQKLKNLRSLSEQPFASQEELKNESVLTYYSDTLYPILHLLLRVKNLRNLESLSHHLKLEADDLLVHLKTLERLGLAKRTNEGWQPVERDLHIEPDSIYVKMLHRNWRQKAAENAGLGRKSDLHYSAMHTLSRSDNEKIKLLLLEAIRKSRKIVGPSKDEMGAAVVISLFEI